MTRAQSRLAIVWLILVSLTLMALASGRASSSPRFVALAVVLAAMVKVRFVVMEFMEIRCAPWPLRLAADAWAIGLTAVLMVLLG